MDTNWINKLFFNGPYIFSFIAVICLWNQKKYMLGFFIFYMVNSFINGILKNLVRDPRPKLYRKIDDGGKYTKKEQYGMPSRHSQTVFYAIMYSWMVLKNVYLLLTGGLIAFITLYQRWQDKKHTIPQLAVGAIVGIIMGWISFEITKKIITDYKKYNFII